MALFTIASLPLMSCFGMVVSSSGGLVFRGTFVYGDGAGLGAGVETKSAAVAAVADVDGGMIAVAVEPFTQPQAFQHAGIHAQAAALAFLRVDDSVALVGPGGRFHGSLVIPFSMNGWMNL